MPRDICLQKCVQKFGCIQSDSSGDSVCIMTFVLNQTAVVVQDACDVGMQLRSCAVTNDAHKIS